MSPPKATGRMFYARAGCNCVAAQEEAAIAELLSGPGLGNRGMMVICADRREATKAVSRARAKQHKMC